MTRALRERLPVGTSVREPAYRSMMELTEDERKVLAEKLGSVQNYNGFVLREMARKDRRFFAL